MYQVQIAQSIAIIQKAGQAVVPALHDVLRDTGKVDTRKSDHPARVAERYWCLQRGHPPKG
ncbi:hypothetical protein A7D16_20235 [Xanthomonas nasturtii]|nr:hypothetical protein A7D16_20235 [Xanthomonas nasturtii]